MEYNEDFGEAHNVGDKTWVFKSSGKRTLQYEMEHMRVQMEDQHQKNMELYHDNIVNILSSIQRAGGSIDLLSKDLTVKDFLKICANNNIVINTEHKLR